MSSWGHIVTCLAYTTNCVWYLMITTWLQTVIPYNTTLITLRNISLLILNWCSYQVNTTFILTWLCKIFLTLHLKELAKKKWSTQLFTILDQLKWSYITHKPLISDTYFSVMNVEFLKKISLLYLLLPWIFSTVQMLYY